MYFHNSMAKFSKLKEFGVYFQLNLLSLTGFYGKEVQKVAERLLENNLYDYTGTDIHRDLHIDELNRKPLQFSNTNKIADLLQKNTLFNTP